MNKKHLPFHLLTSVILLLASSLMFSSCLKDDSEYEKQVRIDDQIINKYLTDNNIQAIKSNYGFYYTILEGYYGGGTTLSRGDVVEFYYKISLLNGTVLESISPEHGDKPALFSLLTGTMVPIGLDYGISYMRIGEKFRFFIPSYRAYGSYGCTYFPANSNFIVDITVAGVTTETAVNGLQLDSIQQYVNTKYAVSQKFASGLYFIDSIPGTGDKPNFESSVTVDFARKYLNDTIIKSVTGTSFVLDTRQAVQGLEEGIKQMKEGGSAILIMPSSIGFGESLCVVPKKVRKALLNDRLITSEVEPYSILKYVVKLKSTN